MRKTEIISILRTNPKIKAKEIAKKLGRDKSDVNSMLYRHNDTFVQDEDFRWSLVEGEVQVVFEENKWIDSESFEQSLMCAGLSTTFKSVFFIVTEECSILLEVAARLLSLCNQLVKANKTVTIDFSSCDSARTYLDRIGFMDQLDEKVTVLPNRPKVSAAKKYSGNSDNVVEFGAINIHDPDETLPKRLKNQFVAHAGEKYSDAAFTIFSELFGNVCEHSKTPIPGFAALQKYKFPRPHIQTVVSDSGEGIVGTLLPVLAKHYPKLASRFCQEEPMSGVLLLKEVLENGHITQKGCAKETGGGLGLKRSQQFAVQYNADISVRQETFELKLSYRGGKLSDWKHKLGMPSIKGTHVCFDFFLDTKRRSG